MYLEPEDEYEIFLRKLKTRHEEMIESAKSKTKSFEKLISSFPLYKKAVTGQISFLNYEENCEAVSQLDNLNKEMVIFLKNNTLYIDEQMFFEPQEAMRKIENRVASINRFSKGFKKKLHKANSSFMEKKTVVS